jgi:hypothetical protein
MREFNYWLVRARPFGLGPRSSGTFPLAHLERYGLSFALWQRDLS